MVLDCDHPFDLVLLSAVWMTFRHGPVPRGRRMFEVVPQDVLVSAQSHGLRLLMCSTGESLQAANRQLGVDWTHLGFRCSARTPGLGIQV